MDTVKTFKKEVPEAFRIIKKDEIRKLHRLILEILVDFIHFCDENGLEYYLASGSILGAVREKGIIPWDDDVDIMMPRKDYNRLRDTFESEFGNKYVVEGPGTKQISSLQFLKIRKKGTSLRGLMSLGPEFGVFIDIFPLDYAPKSKIHRYLNTAGYFILKSMHYSVAFYMLYDEVFRPFEVKCRKRLLFSMKVKRLWGKLLASIKPLDKWLSDFDNRLQKTKPTDTYACATDVLPYIAECFPVEYLYPPRKAMLNGIEANIPNKAEKILEMLYGKDYMTPPPDVTYTLDDFLTFDLGGTE